MDSKSISKELSKLRRERYELKLEELNNNNSIENKSRINELDLEIEKLELKYSEIIYPLIYPDDEERVKELLEVHKKIIADLEKMIKEE